MHDPLIDGVDKQALNEGHGGQAESGKRNQRGDDRVVPLQKGQDQGGHHRHADSNFGVIDFFSDRILGTYRRLDA